MRLRRPVLLLWPLLFCLLAASINGTLALRCYFCYGSDESGDCSLPQDEDGNLLVESSATMKITSCLAADEYCYKIHYSFNGKPVTGRGCGNETFCVNQLRPPQTEWMGGITTCDLCSRNLCNSSTSITGLVHGRLWSIVGGLFLCVLIGMIRVV